MVGVEHNALVAINADAIQKLAAGGTHSPKTGGDFGCAVESADLGCQEPANVQNRVDAVVRHFELIRCVEHPAVFEKCHDTAGRGNLKLTGLPGNAEDRRRDAGEPVGDLRELQSRSPAKAKTATTPKATRTPFCSVGLSPSTPL